MAEQPAIAAAVGMVIALSNEEKDEEEMVLMSLAKIAVEEVMQLEEDGLDGDESCWNAITVFIDEYHGMENACFKMHFRMDRSIFETIVGIIGHYLVEKGRLRRERTPLRDIMLMVLWLMATPDSFRSVSLRFGVRPSTLWYFYSYIIEALREMSPTFIRWPDAQEREVIKNYFYRSTGFPGIVGNIDCTHVYITAPTENAVSYRNRHHTYSINTQIVVDHNLLVRELHVGEVGSMNDRRVFRRSSLCHGLLQRGENQLLNADEHILADGGYTLTDFMLIPFVNNGNLNPLQRNFNRKLSQCRVRVENAIGRAKGKWRRLKFLHARNSVIVVDYITAAFVLHNMVNGGTMWEDGELERPIRENEVLGGMEQQVDDPDDPNDPIYQDPEYAADEELLLAAEDRGIERRNFIMDHILVLEEDE